MEDQWNRLLFALIEQQVHKPNRMVHDQHELDRMTDEGCPHDEQEKAA